MGQLRKVNHPDIIVGLDTSDDAGVIRISKETALIQTLDFFTPIVDDPYLFGQIAAANSLSDVYAMGGKPLTAMNIVCFPSCLDLGVLSEILKGGQDKIDEAGAFLMGGHTIEDDEPKYGLSVTGIVHPEKVATNSNGKPGDIVFLTKPIGTGIIATAIKGGLASKDTVEVAVKWMSTLNSAASEIMSQNGIFSCTDITGFGLAGHAKEMAKGSNATIVIKLSNIPIIDGAVEYGKMGLIPAGAHRNREYLKADMLIPEEVKLLHRDLLFDPQTSGGLLISCSKDKSIKLIDDFKNQNIPIWEIGRITEVKGPSLIIEL
jgi:selenide,water dikinase